MTAENTTQGPTLALKLNILQKRDDSLQAIENYYRKGISKRSVMAKLRSKIKVFYLELRTLLIRYTKYNKLGLNSIKNFEDLLKHIESNDPEDLILAFTTMDLILDKKKLIRWDNYKPIDTFDMEAENKANHI